MYTIESVNTSGWRWISGVFLDWATATSELDSITPKPGISHVIVQAQPAQFPIFIIEDHGFHYLTLPTLLERLDSLEPKNDDEYFHFNIYALRAQFKPKVPGRDEMGRILHWHITDSSTKEPRASVFRAELGKIAGDT